MTCFSGWSHRGIAAVWFVLVTRPKHEACPFRSKVEGVRHFNRQGSIVWDRRLI
jgi:hypothetical protein